MLTCRNISLEDDLDWEGLIASSDTASFFQTKEWVEIWVKNFGGEIKILGVFDGENIVGIASFQINNEIVNLLGITPVLGGELVSDFGDIIAIAGREKEIWEGVLKNILISHSERSEESSPAKRDASLDASATPQHDIVFNFIRENSPSFKILKELGGKVEETDVAPYIDLPKSWDEYLSTLDRHDRHELRRKMRKGEAEGVILSEFTGKNEEIDLFLKLMAASNEQKRDFLSDAMKEFFKGIIGHFWAQKMLNLTFLKLGEKTIAGALAFLFKDEILLYNSGLDPKYSHFAPGLILKAYLIKKAIEEEKKRFDFLRGGERYKYDLGAHERKLYKIIFE